MGFDLAKLTREPRTKDVVLTMGKEILRVQVRGLSAAESALIVRAIPRPVPPRKKDPNAGSLSTIPDTEDPNYQREVFWYHAMIRAAEVAVATDLTLKDGRSFPQEGSIEDIKKWIEDAAGAVGAAFSAAEIDIMAAAMMAVSGFETLKAMAQLLVVELPKTTDVDSIEIAPKDPLELPENWSRTDEGLMMRAAKEYGQDPFTWPLTLTSDQRNKVLAEQLIADREQAEMRTQLRILAAALGASIAS